MEERKPFVPHSHLPCGEVGSGFYSIHSIASLQAVKTATPLALRELDAMALEKQTVVALVDYGTADGGTSIELIYACVKAIREKYGGDLPINVIYENQPVNDFTSVFKRTQGLIPGHRSFIQDFPNVFVLASGTNFFDQCFPSNSVTLGFSANCTHWLRDKPCDITGALQQLFITVPEEGEKFRAQAEKDWELYLTKRAAELRPVSKIILDNYYLVEKKNKGRKITAKSAHFSGASGGCMVLAELAVDEHGQYPGHTNNTKVCPHKMLLHIWKTFLNEGIITKEEFTKTNFISFFRTVDDFKKPFMSPDSLVVKAGLDLVSLETKIAQCPHKEKWIKEKGDAEEHAKKFVADIREWSNETFLSGLSSSRSPEEKSKIVNELYRQYEAVVAKCPEDHGLDHVNAYLVIRKSL